MTLPASPTYDPSNFGNAPDSGGPLRPGGQAASGLPAGDTANLPSTLSPAAEAQQAALVMVRDLAGGPEKVRERSTVYLPQAPGEDPQNYRNRLARSVYLNAFAQTIEGLTGFVFRRDPVLGDDVAPSIAVHWENIDNAGTHGDVFARERLQDTLTAGHGAILVDYPDTSALLVNGKISGIEEQENNLRPYWLPVLKDNILSWRTTVENGQTVLTQVVLRECTDVADGLFGQKEQVRYRVLYRDPMSSPPVGYHLLEIDKDKRVVEVEAGYYRNQTDIPLSEIPSSGKRGLFESRPPLADLAHLNIAHYQQWSDYAWILHLQVPVLFGAGFPQEYNQDGTPKPALVIGGNNAVITANDNAKLQYVSPDGAALGEAQKSLDDLKRDMAVMGLSMLSPDKKAQDNSTATAKRIDKASSDSSLSVTARGLQDALERCLKFHANYLKLPEGGSIKINRDFENLTLTPTEITSLAGLVGDGLLSTQTLWSMLQEGNVLPADFDRDEERALIEADAQIKGARNEAMGLNADGSPKVQAPVPGQPVPKAA